VLSCWLVSSLCSADMLHPLPVGASDYRHRVGGVIAAMGTDLLGRVLIDSEDVRDSVLALRLLCIS
jgi:hypothetical protein